jgi:hypothetical protein
MWWRTSLVLAMISASGCTETAPSTPTPRVAGEWNGRYTSPDETGNLLWRLSETDLAFTGTFAYQSSSFSDSPEDLVSGQVSGRFSGDALDYTLSGQGLGCSLSMSGSGSVTDTTLSGTLTITSISGAGCVFTMRPGTISLRRQ